MFDMRGIQAVDDRHALAGVDLNLMVALDALLEAENVTRAARRIGLSQSALSSALGRLRHLFGDRLLVRAPGGMAPTPLGRRLREPVRRALDEVAGMLRPPGPFDPRAPHRFRIAVTDYVGLVLLPAIAARVLRAGPAIDLEVRTMDDWLLPADDLDRGALDVAVSFFREVPPRLRAKHLFDEEFTCAVRRGHPTVGRRLGLRQYTALPHLLVSPRAGVTGTVDAALASRGLSRRVAVTVPHFAVAPAVLARTDCVATLAGRVARLGARLAPLRLLAPPLALRGFAVQMVWHPQTDSDPAASWLRTQILKSRGQALWP
jgi:DNA-binding transcriptional LysR family regulator